ncbi:DUF411 domain-containing protein [Capilliphycus salinus ALCB114379]|uniref:DUF411 domain-containing protein n=1 Tax=Capilliphycus salinus TaxID=2768948 RepID=UPI0039A47CDD
MSNQPPTNWLRQYLRPLIASVAGTAIIAGVTVAVWSQSANQGMNPSQATNPAENIVASSAIPLNITVHRSPTCGCCKAWVQHLEANGFQTTDIVTEDVAAVKQEYGIPNELTSCHTAVIDGYAIEGHVPAADIKRLLAEKPQVSGLAVPQMPIGSPGMESGNIKEPFAVLSFGEDGGVKTFNQYQSY